MQEEQKQLETLKSRVEEIMEILGIPGMEAEMEGCKKEMEAPDFWSNLETAKEISQKYEQLRKEIEIWTNLKQELEELESLTQDLVKNPDEDFTRQIQSRIPELEKEIEDREFLLLMSGKHDKNNAIVTFQAGSGGTEAQDWAQMLLRMIVRFCEKKGWDVSVLDESLGQEAGIKSTTILVKGRYAFGYLHSEHGVHRLVRISPFDADKARHTSFASIEVIPEIELASSVVIDPKDLRIDTFMSGGKGGQSVNTTYSAVRIVHIPTGTTVSCQNERSQLQNKDTAMKILHAKLEVLREQEEKETLNELRGEHKSAEWGNQIRSYVLHPYKMVKDLRTRYEESNPDAVLDGELDGFITAFLKHDAAE